MNLLKRNTPAFALAIATIVPVSMEAQSQYDELQPFGFATCMSRTDSNPTTENVTGGGAIDYETAMLLSASGEKKVKVLTADKVSKDDDIKNAVKNNDIVILDGSKGDFTINKFIWIQNYENKTILGINNARLCTKWYVTDDVIKLLQDAGVESASTSTGTGGTLNGESIDEEAEYLTRKTLYEYYGNEDYRYAGVFVVKRCTNMVIRNINFVGPGSIDCGGYDLLAIQYTTNCWVDHCTFTDGIDGNLDITNEADMVTVSWCTFSYTNRSLMHQNTSLCGSSDSKTSDDNKLSITFAYNQWGSNCRARMPMARMGRFHMLNNYFNCAGNKTACINPRKNSEFLIEGNYFEDGVKKVYQESSATAVVWNDDNVIMQYGVTEPASFGSCTVPYDYEDRDASEMKDEVVLYAKANLWNSDAISTGVQTIDNEKLEMDNSFYNIAGQRVSENFKGVIIKNGKKMIVR